MQTRENVQPRGRERDYEPRPERPPTTGKFPTSQKSTLVAFLVITVLLSAGLAATFTSLFSIRSPHGTPVGPSLRATGDIATLIQTLEPYVPSLHRKPGLDRYRLALFLQPANGQSPGRKIELGRGFEGGTLSRARLLGCDGRIVWCRVDGLIGVDLRTGRLIRPADLREANASLREDWEDPRRIEFGDGLRVQSPDRKQVWVVDADTLEARPAPPKPSVAGSVPALLSEPKPVDFLCPGVRPTTNGWLGLHSLREAARDFKPGSWLRPFNAADEAKELRRFHRGELGPELERGNRVMLSLGPVAETEYLNAAFVRAGLRADPLRLSGPDGFLMVYTSSPGLQGTLVVARVTPTGELVWKVDTGLDRFTLGQILPDDRWPAFVGLRPPVPGKVSEPLVVVVDAQSGKAATTTLWQ
jgi:hypothetical protein